MELERSARLAPHVERLNKIAIIYICAQVEGILVGFFGLPN